MDNPNLIPIELVMNTGEEIASIEKKDGLKTSVYCYGKWFLVLGESQDSFHIDAQSAFGSTEIWQSEPNDIINFFVDDDYQNSSTRL